MRVAALLCALLLSGCVTQGYKDGLESWVGAPQDELIAAWGPPDGGYTRSNGTHALLWVYRDDVLTDGFGNGGLLIPLRCKTWMYIDRANLVESWAYEGNSCFEQRPRRGE